MHLDALQALGVAARPRELDPCRVGAAQGEPALLQQQPLLLGVHEPCHVDVGRQRVVGVQARHLGVDKHRAPLARQRDAVVAVGDEKQPAYVVDLDPPACRRRGTRRAGPRAGSASGLGRHASDGGHRVDRRAGDRDQGRPAPGSHGRPGPHGPRLSGPDPGVRRRHLSRGHLLRAAGLRPRARGGLCRGVDRLAGRRCRDGRGAGIGAEQLVVPDRRGGWRRDPLDGRRVPGRRKQPARRAHQRRPVRLRNRDHLRRARVAGRRRAARKAPRAGPRPPPPAD